MLSLTLPKHEQHYITIPGVLIYGGEGLEDFTSDVNQTEGRRGQDLEAFSGSVRLLVSKEKASIHFIRAPQPLCLYT